MKGLFGDQYFSLYLAVMHKWCFIPFYVSFINSFSVQVESLAFYAVVFVSATDVSSLYLTSAWRIAALMYKAFKSLCLEEEF